MKYSQFCGPRGSMAIEEDIKKADENSKISSIILMIDSPGGTVDYTDVLAETVAETETPVIAFINGLAASAAYWIASGADEIIMNSELAEVGSIGTMVYFADLQPYFEEMKIKFHEFYASDSTEKNALFNEVLEGKYENYIKEVLDPINKRFQEAVKENRPSVNSEDVKGKVYFAQEAIKRGLADSIGSFEFALERADELGSQHSKNIVNNQIKSDMKIKNAWKGILSFLGLEASAKEEDNPVLTEENIEALNKGLEEQGKVIEEASALFGEEAKEEDFDLTAAIKGVQEIAAKVPDLEKKLKARPGAATPEVDAKDDDIQEEAIEMSEEDKRFAELHQKIHGGEKDD